MVTIFWNTGFGEQRNKNRLSTIVDSPASPRNLQPQEQALLRIPGAGSVVRTIFLLRYLSNVELRHTIQAATNKSEAFNRFVQWVCFVFDGGACTLRRDAQIMVDMRVCACQRKLYSGDLQVFADGKHRLPAAGTGRIGKRGAHGVEIKLRELDVELCEPCRDR